MKKDIKSIRTQKGLTQAFVADQVGISVISYQRIEYGTQRPNLQNALDIAKVLGTTVETLWGGNPTRAST